MFPKKIIIHTKTVPF